MSIRVDEIDEGFVPRARAEVMSIELDGELVLTVPSGNQGGALNSHMLDKTASVVWKCLDGQASVADLADDVAHAIDTDPHVVLADLVNLFKALARAGVLEGVID